MPRPNERIDITGQRFGRLVVVGFHSRTTRRRSLWSCVCDCGKPSVVESGNLKTGNTTSCGCVLLEAKRNNRKHGLAHTPTWRSWVYMLARVDARHGPRFRDYGSRGITVCDRWRTFANFLADMGERPSGLTLDRINNDGNYEPGNCRWATVSQQNANQRRSRKNQMNAERGGANGHAA